MYTLNDDRTITAFSADAQPVLRVPDDAEIAIRTKDCYSNNLRVENDPRGEAHGSSAGCNPATGPIFVEGAMPGDTLRCDILSIAVDGYASMRISSRGGLMADRVTERTARCIALKDGQAALAGVTMALDPMIGVIGTAPAYDTVMTHTPADHGGNMDCNKIVKGSTLYLPVNVEGALLSMGDLHALMGDGEVMICGVETGGLVTVRVSVVRDFPMPTPALRCRGRFSTIQSDRTLDEAARRASREMHAFLRRVTGMDACEAAMLLSLKGDLAVCQIVDPARTVRMEIDEHILDDYGVVLP